MEDIKSFNSIKEIAGQNQKLLKDINQMEITKNNADKIRKKALIEIHTQITEWEKEKQRFINIKQSLKDPAPKTIEELDKTINMFSNGIKKLKKELKEF